MHLVNTVKKDDILSDPLITMFAVPPKDKVEESDRLEVWGSDFDDEGDDYCEYRLMNGTEVVWQRRIAGY